jgi:N-acetyl-anhydromuramyl-L-alanine amidase AmpD
VSWSLLTSIIHRCLDTGHKEPIPVWVDDEGWLRGDGVKLVPSHSSWHYRNLSTPDSEPIATVLHYTATDPGTAKSMSVRRKKKRKEGQRAASWHVCVGADGTLWQIVSFHKGAFHCRKGSIAQPPPIPAGGRKWHRVNKCTVGIELEGHGKEFPEAQVKGAEALIRALVDRYGITRENCMHNHSDFDPQRRSDAGPVWNGEHLPGIIERVFSAPSD